MDEPETPPKPRRTLTNLLLPWVVVLGGLVGALLLLVLLGPWIIQVAVGLRLVAP